MKKLKYFIMYLLIILMMQNKNFANTTNDNFVKRIVSVVLDDSWSMNDNKQDYYFADYALQNVAGFMNSEDELYVVRMQDKTHYITIDLTDDKKQNSIDEIQKWRLGANETPFEAVETAVECLKEKKLKYGSSDNIEYWLLVLTDGLLEGMPSNPVEYFENVNDYMSDVKFESIWIFIGNQNFSSITNTLKNISNANEIKSQDKEGICAALYSAADKIYGRTSIKETSLSQSGNKVQFNYEFPISKLTIYEQDQDVDAIDIVSSNENIKPNIHFETKKTNEPILTSKIIEVRDDNKFLNSGDIEVEFSDAIDINKNKFQIMVDTAVALELNAIDESGNEIATDNYEDGEIAFFEAVPINPYDGSIIDVSDYLGNCTAQYEFNKKIENLTYDSKTNKFKFESMLHAGTNNFVASLEIPGYFKIKSNPVNIYVPLAPRAISPSIDKDEVLVSKKNSKEYEKVDSIEYKLENLKEKVKGELLFSDIPDGIQIKVNGSTVKKDKLNLSFNEINTIDIYRNRDYKETDTNNISININLSDKNVNIKDKGVNFILKPVTRTISLKSEKLFDDNLNNGNAYGKNLYKIIPMVNNENMAMQEIKDSKIEIINTGDKVKYKYQIKEENNKNVIYLLLKRSINPLSAFKEKNIQSTFKLTTSFDEEMTYDFNYQIKTNIIFALLGILIPLFVLWYVIGIVKKPRFDNKGHSFIIIKNGEQSSGTHINVYGGLNLLVPYKAEKGRVGDIELMATDSTKKVIVLKKSLKEEMEYDGDEVKVSKDLSMYEEVKLVKKVGREKTEYLYHNVKNELENDKKVRTRRVRR